MLTCARTRCDEAIAGRRGRPTNTARSAPRRSTNASWALRNHTRFVTSWSNVAYMTAARRTTSLTSSDCCGACDHAVESAHGRWRRSPQFRDAIVVGHRASRSAPRRCAARRAPADAHLAPRAAESGCRRRLHDAVELEETSCGARCSGCSGASASESTGAKQTSVPSISSHHSSRVLALLHLAHALLHAGASRSCRAATARRDHPRAR